MKKRYWLILCEYNGDIRTGINLSWPIGTGDPGLYHDLARALAARFQTKVLFELNEAGNGNEYGLIESNGAFNIVTINDENTDLLVIESKKNDQE